MRPYDAVVLVLVWICLLIVLAPLAAFAGIGPAAPPAGVLEDAQASEPAVIGHRLFAVAPTDPVGAYRNPDGVAVDDRDGTVYVVDTANHRITAHAPWGTVLGVIGGRGVEPGRLLDPLGIDVARDGTIYVADAGNARIQRFDRDGRLLAVWGRRGEEEGAFGGLFGRGPVDVAVGIDGAVYVADHYSFYSRVQQFTPGGAFVRAWNTYDCPEVLSAVGPGLELALGAGRTVARSPVAATLPMTSYRYLDLVVAAAADGTVYAGNLSGIGRFTASGGCLGRFGGNGDGPGRFSGPGPFGIDVAPDGDVFVADGSAQRIQRFGPEGAFRALWYVPGQARDIAFAPDGTALVTVAGQVWRATGEGHLLEHWGRPDDWRGDGDAPRGVAVHTDGTVWVSTGDRLQHFGSDGSLLGFVGAPGDAPGRMSGAGALALSPGGRVFAAETGNHRVQVFAADGRPEARWGDVNGVGGGLGAPRGLEILESDWLTGWVVVADTSNDRLMYYHPSGTWFGDSGDHGSAPGQWDGPMGVATTTEGFWVADSGNHRIVFKDPFDVTQIVGEPGAGPGQLQEPHDVAVAADGALLVADTLNHRIQVFDEAGEHVREIGGRGGEPGRFERPESLALSPSGDLYVVDAGNRRVQRFDADGTLLDVWPTFGWARAAFGTTSYHGANESSIDVAAEPDGRFYVADWHREILIRFGADGAFETSWQLAHPVLGRVRPYAVAVGPEARVYVLCSYGTVLVYSADGALLESWTTTSEAHPYVRDIAVAPQGDVYVLLPDPDEPRVHRHAADGTRLGEWSLSGGDPGDMAPISIEVGPDGTVYTLDEYGRSVERYEPTGKLLARFSTGDSASSGYPRGIAVGSDGTVYVSRDDLPELMRFGPDGAPRGRLATPGGCDGRVEHPDSTERYPSYFGRRLAMRADGTLLVAWRSGCVEAYRTEPVITTTWRIERYPNPYLAESPTVIEAADTVDADWGAGARHKQIPPTGFSARLEKRFTIDAPGRLDLDVASTGGMRMWVDDLLVADAWSQEATAVTERLALSPGSHRILVHHRDAEGAAALHITERLASSDGTPEPTSTSDPGRAWRAYAPYAAGRANVGEDRRGPVR